MTADGGRPLLKNAKVPIVEISSYYTADFAAGPMAKSEQQKAGYYAACWPTRRRRRWSRSARRVTS